jgi:hypothetical protein
MALGVVLDRGDYNALAEQEWMEGAVVKSRWTGIKTKDRDRYVVHTYRCERCGYLESYANVHVND